jgi:hypothetical protein
MINDGGARRRCSGGDSAGGHGVRSQARRHSAPPYLGGRWQPYSHAMPWTAGG